ncbi:hypothetical protein HPB51_007892 [Rhipicephalus microplus]|uniref:PH domain-containing protein n=1 Tax=Rhipicephalus microplus TaxID=6941 RepID=A0A9J6ENP2_RHIMP|nr:hypothetical protein HPB51_007892 [Rhipicephalus microplus]
MRFNEKEMATLAAGAADKEGRLNHRNLSFREVFKERWFKLKGNLLFYFRLNEHGGVFEKEPVGLFVIECCKVQHEPNVDYSFAFSIGAYSAGSQIFVLSLTLFMSGVLKTLFMCAEDVEGSSICRVERKCIVCLLHLL